MSHKQQHVFLVSTKTHRAFSTLRPPVNHQNGGQDTINVNHSDSPAFLAAFIMPNYEPKRHSNIMLCVKRDLSFETAPVWMRKWSMHF